MKFCEEIKLACSDCDQLLETKWFDDQYIVAVCKDCHTAVTAKYNKINEE
jgi:hypothetical protein